MRKSISIWSFSPTLSLTDRLRLAREAGFDGFEVDLSDDGPLTPGSSAKEIAGVRTLAEKSGIAAQRPCNRPLLGRESGERQLRRALPRRSHSEKTD